MENRIAVFPGTFDPVTKGHADIVNRAAGLFDKIIIAVGVNTQKKTLFSVCWLNGIDGVVLIVFNRPEKTRGVHF